MLTDYVDFISGAMTTVFAYSLFKSDKNNEPVQDPSEYGEGYLNNYDYDGEYGRTVILTCQTCRKQQKHKEVEHNLYRCTKCKRYIDLR